MNVINYLGPPRYNHNSLSLIAVEVIQKMDETNPVILSCLDQPSPVVTNDNATFPAAGGDSNSW